MRDAFQGHDLEDDHPYVEDSHVHEHGDVDVHELEEEPPAAKPVP